MFLVKKNSIITNISKALCMYENKTINRLNKALDEIGFIIEICEKAGIVFALEERKILKPAITQHFTTLHEQFSKIEKSKDKEILNYFSNKDLNGLKSIRNISSHDYDNLDSSRMECTIRNNLPNFKKDIEKCIKMLTNINKLEKDVNYFNDKKDILNPDAKEKLIKNISKFITKFNKENISIDENLKNDALKILDYGGLKFER